MNAPGRIALSNFRNWEAVVWYKIDILPMEAALSQFREFQLVNIDPEQLRDVIAGGNLEQTILDSGASGSVGLSHWSTDGIQINQGRYSFPVVARGQFPLGQICLGMVRKMRIPNWINGYEVTRDHLQLYAEDAEILYRAGPEVTWFAVVLDRHSLQAAAQSLLGHSLRFPHSGVANLVPDPYLLSCLEQTIKRSIRELGNDVGTASRWRTSVLSACIEAIASADPRFSWEMSQRARYRAEVIARADRFMRANLGGRFTSEQLCRWVGMSERSLQLHFKEALGMSPKQWLHRLALNQARRFLTKHAPESGLVTSVALDCGFEHFGRFAKSYRELFGESPSQTVGRRVALG